MPEVRPMFVLPGPPGTCPECAVHHLEDVEPHDRDSLVYQMRFHALHGRWPSWEDAMAHIQDDHVKETIRTALRMHGIDPGRSL